ncbi:MAG: DUF3782 domain-containing protein [Synechococcaceae cyanobacterium SM1_2_3]|nr:DUF3782 domain-containing protein [Synechococcaceae cyanobacterium SM1_2_3]
MSSTAADEIWALLREAAEARKETERLLKEQSQEAERRSQEAEQRSQEAEQRFQETERRFQETERFLKALSQETDRKIKEVTTSIGRLGNKLGDFVEEMVRPAAVRLFQERGITVHEVHQNVTARRAEGAIEVDLLVVNDGDAVAIECKSTLGIDDVNEHLARLGKLKQLLPTYANKRVLGAVTGMVIPDNVAQYAYRNGLYVIGQTGDHLQIRNDPGFCPRVW